MTLLLMMACLEPADSGLTPPDDSTPVIDSPVDTQPQGCDARGGVSGEVCVLEAPCSWVGDSRAYFGTAMAVGDLDADGAVELVVGAPGHAGTVGTGAGAVFVLSGDGFPSREALISGPNTSDYFGSDVAIVPDAEGDRVLVGAMGVDDDAAIGVGAAVLLNGEGTELARWSGVDAYDRVGWTVHSGADHDGDGVADVWLTSDWRDQDDDPGTGSANLFLGGALNGGSIQDADLTLTGSGRANVGHAYVNGDFDGDGSTDLMVSAPYAEGYKGAVYQVSGGTSPEALPEPWAVGEASSDAFGFRLAAADFDGDGKDELVVGAPLNDRVDNAAGAVFVYSGQEVVSVWTGEWMDVQAGTGLGTADMDQDGQPELLVGSVSAFRGLATHAGRVYVVDALAGGALGDATTVVHGGGTKDYLGHPILGADVDGDGADDLLLGTAYVNQDGAYDVGSVYLFHGQP